MNLLPLDIWEYLSEFINNDTDKCHLLRTCKGISKCAFYFYGLIDFDKINGTQWFDKYTNIIIKEKIINLPLFITHLTIDNNVLIDNIPSSVTHLYFNSRFKQPFKDVIIPSSVTDFSIQNFHRDSWKGF